MQVRDADKRSIGVRGETAVCRFLESKGVEILCRNFTIRGGEIDIIAKSSEYLLFIEVKTREVGAMVSGEAAVDARKQAHLLRTAEQYLLRNPCDLQPRFDVAVVEYAGNFVRRIAYTAHAFDATGYEG